MTSLKASSCFSLRSLLEWVKRKINELTRWQSQLSRECNQKRERKSITKLRTCGSRNKCICSAEIRNRRSIEGLCNDLREDFPLEPLTYISSACFWVANWNEMSRERFAEIFLLASTSVALHFLAEWLGTLISHHLYLRSSACCQENVSRGAMSARGGIR